MNIAKPVILFYHKVMSPFYTAENKWSLLMGPLNRGGLGQLSAFEVKKTNVQ